MEKEDAKAAKIITNDFKQLATFSVDLKAVEFSSLIGEISDVSMVAREFGPEEGISNQKFRKSIEKTFLQMQDCSRSRRMGFFRLTPPFLAANSANILLTFILSALYCSTYFKRKSLFLRFISISIN
jgi:hypothetical protein